jgi:hypothetical protein
MAEWDSQFVKKLWGQINRRALYDWSTGLIAQTRLRNILTSLPLDLFRHSPCEENMALRRELAPYLTAANRNSSALGCWIIKDWGGIRRRADETIGRWMIALDRFNNESVRRFVVSQNINGISSWSKLLAFAKPESQAIYDTRTSVALNCALRTLRDRRQFRMPLGRNRIINVAQLLLLNEPTDPNSLLGYADYIELLNAIVACKLSNSLTEAEMVLFANAPLVACHFASEKGHQRPADR